MFVQMLDNVTPENYGLEGQAGWAQVVQWRKGEFHEVDGQTACMLIDNGDAREVDEDVVDRLIACPYLNAAFHNQPNKE